MNRNGNPKAKSFGANRGGTRKSSQQSRMERLDPNLILRPAYKGQYLTTMKVLGDPISIATTVTSGVIQDSRAISVGTINNFTTRFACFEEYRIIKAQYQLNFFSSVNPGQGNFWLDENSSAAPTATEAQQRSGVQMVPCSSVERIHKMNYTPHSPSEQIWNPIATAQSLAFFKFYTDNANFGSSIVATGYMTERIVFTIQFRGVV